MPFRRDQPSGFTGTLQVDDGRVHGNVNNLGGTKSVLIGNGAQFLAYDGTSNSYAFPQSFSINGMGSGETGYNLGALRVSTMNAPFTGNITLTGDSALFTQNAAGSRITVNGVISGAYNLTINDSYTANPTVLSGENTFSGMTTVGAGALRLANSLALQNSTLASGGISFDAAVASHSFTFGGLSGSGSIVLTDTASNAVAVSVGNNNANTTYSGVLSGGGSLTKIGSGTLTVSGANTFTGGTAVTAGTLLLSGTGDVNSSSGITINGAAAKLVQTSSTASTRPITLTQGRGSQPLGDGVSLQRAAISGK